MFLLQNQFCSEFSLSVFFRIKYISQNQASHTQWVQFQKKPGQKFLKTNVDIGTFKIFWIGIQKVETVVNIS